MLDLHAINGTPGAALVLGSTLGTVSPGDGAQVAGVPIRPDAMLRMWGVMSIAANTVARAKLASQDQVDPLNGEDYILGAASLINLKAAYTKLPYKSGARQIQVGTNTGVGDVTAFTLDQYGDGPCIAEADKNYVVAGVTTFGGALTIGQWGQAAFTPAQALPNGKYAILGAYVSAMSYGGAIRFRHSSFGAFAPGFPVANYEIISTSSWDKIDKDPLLLAYAGFQFVHLSKELGIPCCPVFDVSNAGTGLTIEAISRVADTPVVALVLSKVA